MNPTQNHSRAHLLQRRVLHPLHDQEAIQPSDGSRQTIIRELGEMETSKQEERHETVLREINRSFFVTYLKSLGVSRTACRCDLSAWVNRKRREWAKMYHPDRGGGSTDEDNDLPSRNNALDWVINELCEFLECAKVTGSAATRAHFLFRFAKALADPFSSNGRQEDFF